MVTTCLSKVTLGQRLEGRLSVADYIFMIHFGGFSPTHGKEESLPLQTDTAACRLCTICRATGPAVQGALMYSGSLTRMGAHCPGSLQLTLGLYRSASPQNLINIWVFTVGNCTVESNSVKIYYHVLLQ